MRRSIRVLLSGLLGLSVLAALPAAASAASVGFQERFVEARAFFRTIDQSDDCIQYSLDLSLQAGTWHRLHSATSPDPYTRPQPFAQLYAYYSEWDICEDQPLLELMSWTDLVEGQYAVDKIAYAALYDVPVTVSGINGFSGSESFSVDLEWVGNGDVTPWVVLGGVPVPSPHQPPNMPEVSWVEHYNTASLSGALITAPYPFTLDDNYVSEIGQVNVLISPAR